MPVNSIVHIKPIDVVKGDLEKATIEISSIIDDIKLMKLTIDELKRDIKKINIKLKAKESIENDNIVSGGWWYWS
tara:strand:- start:359 stop:583 length:225 start_codon:yes stop_codon:yes gene_type:complete